MVTNFDLVMRTDTWGQCSRDSECARSAHGESSIYLNVVMGPGALCIPGGGVTGPVPGVPGWGSGGARGGAGGPGWVGEGPGDAPAGPRGVPGGSRGVAGRLPGVPEESRGSPEEAEAPSKLPKGSPGVLPGCPRLQNVWFS